MDFHFKELNNPYKISMLLTCLLTTGQASLLHFWTILIVMRKSSRHATMSSSVSQVSHDVPLNRPMAFSHNNFPWDHSFFSKRSCTCKRVPFQVFELALRSVLLLYPAFSSPIWIGSMSFLWWRVYCCTFYVTRLRMFLAGRCFRFHITLFRCRRGVEVLRFSVSRTSPLPLLFL